MEVFHASMFTGPINPAKKEESLIMYIRRDDISDGEGSI